MNEKHAARGMTRRQFAGSLAGGLAGLCLARRGFAQDSARPFRVAVSLETLAGANVNDARAAYKVWAREVTASLGVKTAELVPDIFVSSEQIIRMVREQEIDLFGITAWEYAKLVDSVDPTSVLVEDSLAEGMEYVLLVHNASSFKSLRDLHGGQITIHRHRDMNLVPAWIGNLLAADGLPRMDAFFANQISNDSITQVVLPVFFRRIEAACLSLRHFETAVEMNPQLGKDLRALEVSPKVIPIALCFRKNCSPEGKRVLKDAIARAATIPAGQQIVALYQSRTLVSRPASCMNDTIEMLRQYARVPARTPGARKERS